LQLGLIQLDYTTPNFSQDIDLGRVEGDNPTSWTDRELRHDQHHHRPARLRFRPWAAGDETYGLASQVDLLLAGLKNPGFARAYEDADVIISVCSNDVFQFLNTNLFNGVIP
jgi:hypothetical protein